MMKFTVDVFELKNIFVFLCTVHSTQLMKKKIYVIGKEFGHTLKTWTDLPYANE